MHTESNLIELKHGQKPDVEWLKDTYAQTIRGLSSWTDQAQLNYKTRYAEWDSLSDTQRKGPGELPYEGAADLRQFIADDYCNKNVALLKTSLFNANLAAIPVEGGDVKQSGLVSVFMRWMLFSQMDELSRESEVLANYMEEKGYAALGVFWKTEEVLALNELTIESLEEGNEGLDLRLILEEDEEGSIEFLKSLYPTLSRPNIKKAIKGLLSEEGVAEFPELTVVKNRPFIRAYTIDEDFAFPYHTVGSIQNSPYVFCADYYSPEDLMGEVNNSQWDKKAVEEVVAVSRNTDPHQQYQSLISKKRTDIFSDHHPRSLIKVVTCYYKGVDDKGVPGVFYSVFHPDTQKELYHTLLDYKPSRYPFVDFPRECVTTRVLDSRGSPEIIKGTQDEIKLQRDCRMDRTAIATVPPLEVPLGRRLETRAPGTQIEVLRPGQHQYMDIPAFDPGSREIEETLLEAMDRYFGRDPERPEESRVVLQRLVDNWLLGWKMVARQIWMLYRQYGPDEEYFRVIGANEEEMQRFSKDEVPEKYDIYFNFDTVTLDRENHLKTLETLGNVIAQHDRTGQVDFGKFIRIFINAINPTYADEILQPQNAATQKEIEQTQSDLSKMASGIAVNAPQNANVQLRNQVIQEYITIPQNQQRLQGDELFQQLLEQYSKSLQLQVQQQQNAVIGRGQIPGAGPASS